MGEENLLNGAIILTKFIQIQTYMIYAYKKKSLRNNFQTPESQSAYKNLMEPSSTIGKFSFALLGQSDGEMLFEWALRGV